LDRNDDGAFRHRQRVGLLSGQQTATLTSNQATFNFEDSPDDVSDAGVNFFNQSANTSVFAKFDATLGNNLEGYGGKAGIRASC
jgi:autotransporter family porin